jgi:hypothetical protein
MLAPGIYDTGDGKECHEKCRKISIRLNYAKGINRVKKENSKKSCPQIVIYATWYPITAVSY